MSKSLLKRASHWLKQFVRDPEYKLVQVALRFVDEEKLPDRMVVKYQFHNVFGYPLDLKHPKAFNEKLQWLKLYDRNPLYTTLVDKYRVKQWVADKIGEQYLIPTLAVYNSVDEIDLDKLPDKFVLKCNHDSGSVVICRDKSAFDFDAAKRSLQKCLNTNFYLKHREWPYKNVKRCIIAEEYLESTQGDLRDYKFFCFDGKVKFFQINIGRFHNHLCIYFDCDGNRLPWKVEGWLYDDDQTVEVPNNLPKLIEIAENLSCDFPFVRIDLYTENDIIKFGEFTFSSGAGLMKYVNGEFEEFAGGQIRI